MRENDQISGGTMLLRLQRSVKTRYAYRILWLMEDTRGKIHACCATRRTGGKAEIRIELEGELRWRTSCNAVGEWRVLAWPAGPCPPSIVARTAAFAAEDGTLARALEVLSPQTGSQTGQTGAQTGEKDEPLEALLPSIQEAAAGALERWYAAAVSEAWSGSGELAPLIDVPLKPEESAETVLARLANDDGGGDGESLRMTLPVSVDLWLRMPPLHRVAIRDHGTILEHSRVEMEGNGGIAVIHCHPDPSTRAAVPGVILSAGSFVAASRRDRMVFQLAFEHRQRNTPAQMRLLLPKLVSRYGMEKAARTWMTGRQGEVEATIQVTLTSEATPSWLSVPSEKRAGFYDQFSMVSRSVQRVLRQWLPYLHFQDPARFLDFRNAHALLVFSQIREFRSKQRLDYTYDVLNSSQMEKALRRVTKPLTEWFTDIRRYLNEQGPAEAASHYVPRRVLGVARSMLKLPKQFGILMQADVQLVCSFMEFCSRSPQFMEHPEQLFTAGASLAESMTTKLRRLASHQEFAVLTPLLLIEATCALATAQDKRSRLNVALRLRESGGPEHMVVAEIVSE